MAERTLVDQLLEMLHDDLLAGGRYVSLSAASREFVFGERRGAAPGRGSQPATPRRPAADDQPLWRPPTAGEPVRRYEPARPEAREARPVWRPPDDPGRQDSPPAAEAAPAVPAAPVAEVSRMSLAELAEVVKDCRNCQLCAGRRQAVFGEGNPAAELMFIGEGPGADEDWQGRPFVGKAGHLLDNIIHAMQFRREEVYIANIVKCRPPGNRAPDEQESRSCMPYLKRQIELIRPKTIVTLGATPLLALTGRSGVMRNRGHWLEYEGIPVMPTFHPSYLLRLESVPKRFREEKAKVWTDMQAVMRRFGKDPDQSSKRGS